MLWLKFLQIFFKNCFFFQRKIIKIVWQFCLLLQERVELELHPKSVSQYKGIIYCMDHFRSPRYYLCLSLISTKYIRKWYIISVLSTIK